MTNILFCVTGPSGSGKTSIMKEVMKNEVGSFTTRQMREGEVQGREYDFITIEKFQELHKNGLLAEWTEYDGNFYGTSVQELNYKLSKGHAYVICDNHGFQQFEEVYPNVVSIFLYASKPDCFDNMNLGRGDSYDKARARISTYDDEVANKGQYDYVVKNIRGMKQFTIDIVKNIIRGEAINNMNAEDSERV